MCRVQAGGWHTGTDHLYYHCGSTVLWKLLAALFCRWSYADTSGFVVCPASCCLFHLWYNCCSVMESVVNTFSVPSSTRRIHFTPLSASVKWKIFTRMFFIKSRFCQPYMGLQNSRHHHNFHDLGIVLSDVHCASLHVESFLIFAAQCHHLSAIVSFGTMMGLNALQDI